MTSIHIAAIHGVNHSLKQQRNYGKRIQAILDSHGLDTTVTGIYWSSVNSAPADYIKSFAGSYEKHIKELVSGYDLHDGLRNWLNSVPVGEPRLILAHSWGTVLAYNIKLTNRWLNHVPMIGIGSPFGRPSMRSHLAFKGRAKAWPNSWARGIWPPPTFIWNPDDPIAAMKLPLFNSTIHWKMSGCKEMKIEPSDDGNFIEAHDEAVYLSQKKVHETICLTSGT